MGKIVGGVSLLILSFGLANAEEYMAQITKVEGMKVTAKYVKIDKDAKKGDFKKGGFKDVFKDAESKPFTTTTETKIVKGKYNKEEKKLETTALEDGLKNKLFLDATTEKPLFGRITTNDKGEVTEIRVGGKGFGGGNFKKKKKDAQ